MKEIPVPVQAISLGFPRIGAQRELKSATEGYWKGTVSRESLLQTANDLRLRHWALQRDAGIDIVPCNDFSLYDQVLDMACLLGCVPERFACSTEPIGLDTYFALARGSNSAHAMEMTKWFDTNYHYLVPEFERGQLFRVASSKVFDECAQARAAGFEPAPVLIGPVTFALLGKARYERFRLAETIEALLPAYGEILERLAALTTTVQIDEPCLVTDLSPEAACLFMPAYDRLASAASRIRIRLATYFNGLGENLGLAFNLPIESVHIDLVRAPGQLDDVLERAAEHCPPNPDLPKPNFAVGVHAW